MESQTPENLSDSELVTFGDYIMRAKLGASRLATVWKAEHRISGQVVALKQIYLSKLTTHLKKCLDCELSFLSSVNHPNIILLLDFFQESGRYCGYFQWVEVPSIVDETTSVMSKPVEEVEGCVYLVLEFCAGGNLASYILQHREVQEQTANRFMRQLGAGLEVLNSHHIIHRDLKPENILLSSADSDAAVLKISDFGLSRILRPGDCAETVCGSPLYMAPEILQFQRYSNKVDMWSVGAILFELLNGHPPFHGRTNVEACRYLPFSHNILPRLHRDCLDLCSRLLSKNPENRLSFDEFYHHNFIRYKSWGGTPNSESSETSLLV